MTQHIERRELTVGRRHQTGRSTSPRRGAAVGIAGLAGLAAAALGVVGVGHEGSVATQQRDVALVNTFGEEFNQILLDTQVAFDGTLFTNQMFYQKDFYYTVAQLFGDKYADMLLLVDPKADPAYAGVFNGAFTRFVELNEVDHAALQAEWDHFVGVNSTVPGGGIPGGYEEAIAEQIYHDISPTGIPDSGALHDAVAAFAPGAVADTYSAFHTDLFDLQTALFSTGVQDFFGGLF